MGQPKQLLMLDHSCLLDHTIEAVHGCGIPRPILVLGAFKDKIMEQAKLADSCEIVINEDYVSGQASSLKHGVSNISCKCDAVIFLLCDQPMVRSHLLCQMMDEFIKTTPDILYPTYQNQRGNPVIISNRLFPRLMEAKGDKGARFLFADAGLNINAYPVNDPAVVMDIDTPEDYELILGKQNRKQ